MAEVAETLKDRSATHGSFHDNGVIAIRLREVLRNTPNWKNLTPDQQLALEEIALKIARLLSQGAPVNFEETWHDIAGYATLGQKACKTRMK